jgi:hypothetical protein
MAKWLLGLGLLPWLARCQMLQSMEYPLSIFEASLSLPWFRPSSMANDPRPSSNCTRWDHWAHESRLADVGWMRALDEFVRQANPDPSVRRTALQYAADAIRASLLDGGEVSGPPIDFLLETIMSFQSMLFNGIHLAHLGGFHQLKAGSCPPPPIDGREFSLRLTQSKAVSPAVEHVWNIPLNDASSELRARAEMDVLRAADYLPSWCHRTTDCHRMTHLVQWFVPGVGFGPGKVRQCGTVGLQTEQYWYTAWFRLEEMKRIAWVEGVSNEELDHCNGRIPCLDRLLHTHAWRKGSVAREVSPAGETLEDHRVSSHRCMGVVFDYCLMNAAITRASVPWLRHRVLVTPTLFSIPSPAVSTGLARPRWTDRTIPVLFFGTVSPRRSILLEELSLVSGTPIFGPNARMTAYGGDRPVAVSRARAVLNIRAEGPTLSLLASGMCGREVALQVERIIGPALSERLRQKLPSVELDARGNMTLWWLLVRAGLTQGQPELSDIRLHPTTKGLAAIEARTLRGGVVCEPRQTVEVHRLSGIAANAGLLLTEGGDDATNSLLRGGRPESDALGDPLGLWSRIPTATWGVAPPGDGNVPWPPPLAVVRSVQNLVPVLRLLQSEEAAQEEGPIHRAAETAFHSWRRLWLSWLAWWPLLPWRLGEL